MLARLGDFPDFHLAGSDFKIVARYLQPNTPARAKKTQTQPRKRSSRTGSLRFAAGDAMAGKGTRCWYPRNKKQNSRLRIGCLEEASGTADKLYESCGILEDEN